MHRYLAYGLGVHSELQLFDLPEQEVEPDVTIRIAGVEVGQAGDEKSDPYIKLTPQEAIYSMAAVGKFYVNCGREITVDPDPDADLDLVRRYLIGVATALLLYQRRGIVLHASAVNIDGKGVVFLGGSGAGKSSMAAALMAKGHDLLVDDVTSIQIDVGTAWLYPGYPYIKLSDEALSSINPVPKQLRFVDQLEDKFGFRILKSDSLDRVPLEKIYILLPGEPIRFARYNFQQALIELIRYSIPARMVQIDYAAHFGRCVDLVNCVPVFSLQRPVSLSGMSELVDRVAAHAASGD